MLPTIDNNFYDKFIIIPPLLNHMEEYKTRFIDFLLRTGALKVGEDFSLKSKRISPWFVNIGDFDDGETSAALGEFYADSILNSGADFDLLYGIPEKGNGLAVATAIEMARKKRNVPRFSTRKFPKDYGEASVMKGYGDARNVKEFITLTKHLPQTERIKSWVIGRAPKNGQSIVQLDDVFTAGDAKYEARELLQFLGDFNFPLLVIGVDRQEVGIDATGRSAIEEYEQKTGTRVVSVVNALDVYDFLRRNAPVKTATGEIRRENVERMAIYLRVYGTQTARKEMGALEQRIIEPDRSVIPACDVPFEQFEPLVRETADVPGIGGYKIPLISGRKGWETWISTARRYTDKPLIFDGQKLGTDIPDTGQEVMKNIKEAGFDAVILFPQAGPETERAWIYHALDKGLKVIVGGRMTHPAYTVSEGGFITDEGALDMYRIAARAGINNFVVPGNKPDVIKQVKDVVEAEGVSPVFYAPGFIAQGGSISDAAKVAGERFHGIVGRGIYQALDIKAAAIEHASQIS